MRARPGTALLFLVALIVPASCGDDEPRSSSLVNPRGNTPIAGGAADQVGAGGGNDRVFGGAGPDLLFGKRGNDRLNGGPGGTIAAQAQAPTG